VTLVAGEDTPLTPTLSPTPVPTGRLVVRGSAPASARVTIRGEEGSWSLTPGGALDLEPGSYVVEASADGFEPFRSQVAVRAGAETAVALAMERRPSPPVVADPPPPAAGTVRIRGELPAGGRLVLEGGGGPREISGDTASVPPGAYTLRVSAAGRGEVEIPVTVRAGDVVVLDVPALPLAEAVRSAALRAVDDVVARFHRRDAAVADLMADPDRTQYRRVLSDGGNVADLSATLLEAGSPTLDGSSVVVRFVMRLAFRSANIPQRQDLTMVVRLSDRSGVWSPESLEVVR
jgi:hypothetical protein